MYELVDRFTNYLYSVADERIRLQQSSKDYQTFLKYPAKSRYQNIVPYLKNYPLKDLYFNGNIVSLKYGAVNFDFLVTQAPTDLFDFYTVILDFKPYSIIQVTQFIDGYMPKAERYVPLAGEKENKYNLKNAITCTRVSKAIKAQLDNHQEQVEKCLNMYPDEMLWFTPNLQLNDISVQTEKYEEVYDFYCYKLIIYQKQKVFKTQYIYFPKWNDFSAPDTFHEVYYLCYYIENYRHILVHCSAGIGRSSTFCICFFIYEYFREHYSRNYRDAWKELPIDIFDIIEEFRSTRHPQCVYTVEQFYFILNFCNYCNK